MKKTKANFPQAIVLELQIQFLAEKRTKPYKWYGEGSIAGENWMWSQEALAGHGLRT
jgi:hypothetical protein